MTKLGCFRPALFGCLGIVAILVLGLGITSLVALRGINDDEVVDWCRSRGVPWNCWNQLSCRMTRQAWLMNSLTSQ